MSCNSVGFSDVYVYLYQHGCGEKSNSLLCKCFYNANAVLDPLGISDIRKIFQHTYFSLICYLYVGCHFNTKNKETSIEGGEKCEKWIISVPLNYVSKHFSFMKVARA